MKTIISFTCLVISLNGLSQFNLYEQTSPAAATYIYTNIFTDEGSAIKAADDFTVPAGEVWTITQLENKAYTATLEVPDSVLIEIFSDNNGYPGAVVFSDTLLYDICFLVGYTAFTEIHVPNVQLNEGTYWLAITAFTEEADFWTANLLSASAGHEAVAINPSGYAGPVMSNWTKFSDAGMVEKGLNFTVIGFKGYAGLEISNFEEVMVYPNPFSSTCTIVLPEDVERFEITDITGNSVTTINRDLSDQYDLSFLADGIYMISWIRDNQVYQQKIIKS